MAKIISPPEIQDDIDSFMRSWEDTDTEYITANTSGSTGKPKEIKLLKSDMLHSAMATNIRFGLDSSSCMLLPLSSSYIAGKMMIVRAIAAGCVLYAEKPSSYPVQGKYPRIDLLPIVPAQAQSLIDRPYLAQNVTNIIIGGAPLHPSTESALISAGYNAFATYGMTETYSHVALRKLGGDIFKAMPGIAFGTNRDSCLTIHCTDGSYSWNSIETNDIVELHGDTGFIWRGRRDFVINSGGIKIFPEEIERILAHYLDSDFYIVGTPHPKWGEAVTLVIADNCMPTDEILGICRKMLPRYWIPSNIVITSHIHRTASGKIIRKRPDDL